MAVLVVAGSALLSCAARAAEVPPLLPGRVASVAGTHISCAAGKTSVTCKKVHGLTATIVQTGVVHVTRDSRRLTSTAKPRVLHDYDGFNIVGTKGVGIYCHVYVAGKPTLNCSLDDTSLVHDSQGFDMTESSVVVFRYDRSGGRHSVRTVRQP